MSLRGLNALELGFEGGDEGFYRSIMVIQGETRPEAQVAAVKSEVTRHGKLIVFQS